MLIRPEILSKTQFFVGVQKQFPNPIQTLISNLSATFIDQMNLFLGQTLYEIQVFYVSYKIHAAHLFQFLF